MQLFSIAAATALLLVSISEAAPSTSKHHQSKQKASGLDKIKHVVYFMQVCKNNSSKLPFGAMIKII
jgi:hypothetical protein